MVHANVVVGARIPLDRSALLRRLRVAAECPGNRVRTSRCREPGTSDSYCQVLRTLIGSRTTGRPQAAAGTVRACGTARALPGAAAARSAIVSRECTNRTIEGPPSRRIVSSCGHVSACLSRRGGDCNHWLFRDRDDLIMDGEYDPGTGIKEGEELVARTLQP